MHDVARILDIEHGRQLALFAALQRLHRAALEHRLLGLPVLVMQRQHHVHEWRGIAFFLELLRVSITSDRIDDWRTHDNSTHCRIFRRSRQRYRSVARIARTHPEQHRLMAAARDSEGENAIGARVELRGLRLQPSNPIVYVHQRSGVGSDRRHAKIQRRHQDAASREAFVDGGVIQSIAEAPRAAVQLDDRWKRSGAARLEQAREQRRIAVAQILHIFDLDCIFEISGSRSGHNRDLL